MILHNPYTHIDIEYDIDFDANDLNYHIQHETPFDESFREWAVSVLENGDTLYIPYGNNRRTKIYIVTAAFMRNEVQIPYGIYTLPLSYFYGASICDHC